MTAMNLAIDSSRRFILLLASTLRMYLANLAALWQTDPELAEQIESPFDSPGPYPTQKSKAGLFLPTLALNVATIGRCFSTAGISRLMKPNASLNR